MTSQTTPGTGITADRVRQAAVIIQKIRPDYSPMIEFYSRIFSAQAEAMADISPAPIWIDPEMLALKEENDMPLISPFQFTVDAFAAKNLMETIADLAVSHAPKLADAGRTIQTALQEYRLDLSLLFDSLLDSRSITEQARTLSLTTEELGFFGYNAMFPSIRACAVQLATYLNGETAQNKGYCPVCGTSPDLAFLDDSGAKQASCSLCGHTWKVQRMGCLFCDALPSKDQQYFFLEQEKEYRIYYCEACKNYLKTIDTRELGRSFIPRLEQVATLHLDLKAKEQGLTRFADSLI